MSRNDLYGNIGQIAVRKDECFWIFPTRYVEKSKYYDLYSPWFPYFGEKWQFIMSRKDCNCENTDFYLRRQFCGDLPGDKYTLQLKLKTIHGEQIAFSENDSNCDYGFQVKDFLKTSDLLNPQVTDCGQIKIFFVMKEKGLSGDDLSLSESTEDEMTSDEEDSEKKRVKAEDKGVKRLLQNFRQLLIDGTMSDTVLKVNGHEFKVHKLVLVARSPVFASMFEHDMAEKKDNAVDIPDCVADSFEVFLHYLYCGSTDTMSTSNVYNVYYAADKYQVDDLKKKCVKFMKMNLSVETFCDVITLSLHHGESKLKDTAIEFFCRNFKKILKTTQWQKYLAENPTYANELLIKAVAN